MASSLRSWRRQLDTATLQRLGCCGKVRSACETWRRGIFVLAGARITGLLECSGLGSPVDPCSEKEVEELKACLEMNSGYDFDHSWFLGLFWLIDQ